MSEPVKTAHEDLHSEQGAERGDRADRVKNPVIKVEDLAWVEFEKPDLEGAERFGHDFGFTTAHRDDDAVHLRGTLRGSQCVIVRKGPTSRFSGLAFRASDRGDLERLARTHDTRVLDRRDAGGGAVVELRDPSGLRVQVVAEVEELPELPRHEPATLNFGTVRRTNETLRTTAAPTGIERLGHLVLQKVSFERSLDWYLENFGLIVSDFMFLPGQRERGPAMAFIRCDRGSTPADHHTLALSLGPKDRYIHTAYQMTDLDAVAAGGEYLKQNRYQHAWGIGRHIQGSQIFDYWRDPDGFMVEHFADGDFFDNTVEAGWAQISGSGLAQWGPPAGRAFFDIKPSMVVDLVSALRDRGNEFDLHTLRALLKVSKS